MARILLLIAKYTVFVSVVLVAGLAIERLVKVKHWWTSDSITADDILYNVSSSMASKDLDSVLSKNYLKCLTEPAKPFCLLSANRRLEIFRNEQEESTSVEVIKSRLRNINSEHETRKHEIHSLLATFSELMTRRQVRLLMIEPSVMFCLLSPAKKFGMLSRGFNPGRYLGSRNVVTLGILAEDAGKLEEATLIEEAFASGFKIVKHRKWIGEDKSAKSFETVHCFYIRQDVAVHVVVFHHRSEYLWHAGLDPEDVEFEGLLFVDEEIFENFMLSPLQLSGTSIPSMYLPGNIRYFMKEMDSSKVVVCRDDSTGNDTLVTLHPNNLTAEQLRTRTVITLKELKMALSPHLAFFWLWSETLLGWFTECNIFYNSTALNLAATSKSLQGLNFTHLLDNNDFLTVAKRNRTDSVYELNCHGLLINVFVLHEEDDGRWYTIQQNRRINYPEFQLCSSQLFGEKINVPCNPEEIWSAVQPDQN